MSQPALDVLLLRDRLSGVDWLRWQESALRSGEALQEVVAGLSIGQPLDWWVSSPASRNPFVSSLYRSMCIIHYVAASLPHWRASPPRSLTVDTAGLASVLRDLLQSNGLGHVQLVAATTNRALKVWQVLKNALGHLVRFAILGHPRMPRAAERNLVTIVDIFVLKGWRGGDRYYGDMLQMLTPAEASGVCLVPECLSASPLELIEQKELLRRGRAGVIFKESLLGLGDYFFALSHVFRVRSLVLSDVKHCGISISGLVREEINSLDGFDQAVRGLLNYRFFMRFASTGMRPRRIIDWFENQALDKGWNLGANTFLPESETVGYQPFADVPSYFCMFPARYEHDAGVLPGRLALMGEGYRNTRTRHFPEMPTDIAPAFRFAHLWRQLNMPESDKIVVLVTLPIDHAVGRRMLEAVVDLFVGRSLDGRKIELRIKAHPVGLGKATHSQLERNFIWEDRAFEVAVDEATVLLSTMSNTCLEAIMRNVPVLIFEDKSGSFNTIPEDVSTNFWRVCSTPEEILEAVWHYASRKADIFANAHQVDSIKKNYFEPVTTQSARIFLGLD